MNLTTEQQHIIELVSSGNNIAIQARAGSGKAQPVSCKVQTPFGEVTLKDLQIGDSIFKRDGSIGKVTGKFPQGIQDTYKVTFRDKSFTFCNLEHLWNVERLSDKKATLNGIRYNTFTLAEILKRGITNNRGVYKHKIPLCLPVQYPAKTFFIHPYLLGLLIGDGSLCNGTPFLSVGRNEWTILDTLQQYLPEGFTYSQRLTSENCKQLAIQPITREGCKNSNLIMKTLRDYKLDVRSVDKFIPEDYLQGSITQRLELLRGLMDSDGTSRANRISFSTTSTRLVKDLIRLVQSLGGTAIENAPRYKEGYNTEYSVNVKMFANPFKVASKASNWKFSTKNPPSRYITSVELVGKEEQVCIKVGAEDSLYLTDQFIVTHNTSTLKLIASSYPEKTFGAIYFNKANVEELNTSFGKPSNLIGTTIHGAAYKAIMLGGFVNKLSPYLDFNDIPKEYLENLCKSIGLPKHNWRKESITFTKTILEVIKEFCKSDSYDLESFAKEVLIDLMDGSLEGCEDTIVPIICKHWKYITSGNSAKITHDVYLKMFHLGKYQLTELWDSQAKYLRKIDIICLDECQDSSPVTIGIIANQNLQKIVVGDSAQSIYGWRGAIGAMDAFSSWEQASLTTSFRFTQEIADLANFVLKKRGEGNLLVGAGKSNPKEGKVILCRKNATMWRLAFERAVLGQYTYVESDFKALKSNLFHISALMSGNVPKYPSKELSMYKSKEELVKGAKIHDELGTLIQLGNTMRNFGSGLTDSLTILQKFLVEEKTPEVLCLSSIHKSKGLQWNEVTIADDFLNLPEMEEFDVEDLVEQMWEDEEMTSLLYVAITRAKEKVNFPWYLEDVFGE